MTAELREERADARYDRLGEHEFGLGPCSGEPDLN